MKMAKPSQRDIDAAGDAMSILIAIDRGDYPRAKDQENAPDWFDEDDPEHLRHFYDAMKATLDTGWPGRVIGGMCYVIMNPENEILDPESDTLDLHPKFAAQEARLDNAMELLKTITGDVPGLVPCTMSHELALRVRDFVKGQVA